ncbi:transcription factor 7-like 1-C [Stigmatopora argus]
MGNSKSCSRKMRIKGPHDPNTPYIKKPLNAFMLFMKEQRPLVKPKMIKRDSASVNQVLGQMWKSLTVAERQYYFNESERLKNIHAIEYPNWSSGDNYGLKKGRVWCSKASKLNNPIVSPPELPPPVGSSIMQEGPQCDLISTVLGELEAMDPSTSTIPILNSEPDADLTSMLFEELEAMELAEVSSTDSSSSSSLDAGPDPDLTTVLF